MEKVKITFLGTSNAIPTKKRNHTAIVVSYKNETILVDCGEGTQRQFKIAKISPFKITKLLITHWHGDHILGLPGLFQTLVMSGYEKTLKIYGPKRTKFFLSTIEKLMGEHKIETSAEEIISGKFIDTPEFSISAEPMEHGTPTLAYSLIIKDRHRLDKAKIKKLGLPNSALLRDLKKGKDIKFNNKKIKASDMTYLEKGKKITIILDTAFNEKAIKFAKDSDLLICEAMYLSEDAETAKEYKHLTATQAAEIAKKSKSKNLVLTHISQRYEHEPEKIEKEAKEIFPNSKTVKDFDSILV